MWLAPAPCDDEPTLPYYANAGGGACGSGQQVFQVLERLDPEALPALWNVTTGACEPSAVSKRAYLRLDRIDPELFVEGKLQIE
jgi:hypothetical protein